MNSKVYKHRHYTTVAIVLIHPRKENVKYLIFLIGLVTKFEGRSWSGDQPKGLFVVKNFCFESLQHTMSAIIYFKELDLVMKIGESEVSVWL